MDVVLEPFLRVVDRLISLTETREKNARRLYEGFVSPAMTDFEVMHQGYVERLIRYEALVGEPRRLGTDAAASRGHLHAWQEPLDALRSLRDLLAA
jgi:hypothetical protein